MASCPSCGRDPGPNDICSYCGADIKRRMKIRTFGIASIVIAIVGLIVLWFFATHAPIARLKIDQIQSTSNYAYAQIEGAVSRVSSYNADSQSLTFWVRDDTGEMMVSAFRAQVQDLNRADKIPAPGDAVSVQGTVRVREAIPSLTLDSADGLTLSRVTTNALLREIGSITADDALQGVTVHGSVRAIKSPFAGLKLITLRDQTGAIDVAVPTDLEPLLGAAPPLTIGQSVQVIGAVTLFETTPQLTLHHGADITPLAEKVEFARPTSVGDLSEALAGRWVWLHGTLERVDPFSAGARLTLSDNAQRATVLIWQDLWSALVALQPELQAGAQLSVQGQVSVFRGDLEIVPEITQDMELLQAAPEAAAALKPIGAIAESDVRSIVMTSGTIETLDPFAQGIRYRLADRSGAITLLIWNNVIDPAQQQQLLKDGSAVSVTGRIDLFNRQLEIVPESIDQVVVNAAVPAATVTFTPTPVITLTETATPAPAATQTPASTTTAEPTPTSAPAVTANVLPIGSLTKERVGQEVAVRGKVVETASFSAGFKFLLDDGTGRIELTLFSDNYKFVPNRAGLNLGADVTVAAVVAEFKGVLELQPKSGRAVTINAPGSSASVPVKPINSLTKAGILAAIEGTITDVKGFSSGTNIFVDDGTGNVRVTVFSNVFEYVPNAAGLVIGAKVRVVGKTDFFGRLEIVPALGYDVTIQ